MHYRLNALTVDSVGMDDWQSILAFSGFACQSESASVALNCCQYPPNLALGLHRYNAGLQQVFSLFTQLG